MDWKVPQLRTMALVVTVVLVAVLIVMGWMRLSPSDPGDGFVSGNGRIEATEIDVATKLPGRVEAVLVREGDFVSAGQPLAKMQIEVLQVLRLDLLLGVRFRPDEDRQEQQRCAEQ